MAKFFKNMGHEIYAWWLRFIDSFRVRPWKICTILFMVPGLFIGLFLGTHYEAMTYMTEEYAIAGFVLFCMIMLGCINIFNAFGFSSKRSWFMAIFSSCITVLLLGSCVWYTILFIQNGAAFVSDIVLSLIVVWVSSVCSLAASVLTYFFIDHNREKE